MRKTKLLKKGIAVVLAFSMAAGMAPVTETPIISKAGEITLVGTTTVNEIKYTLFSDGVARVDKHTGSPVDLTIPSTVEYNASSYHVQIIGEQAFWGSQTLESITLPEGIVSIYNSAFYDCDKLVTVNLPSTLEEIQGGAFCDCDILTNVALPKNLQYIGVNAFNFCASLSTVTLPENLTFLGGSAFYATAIESIHIPGNIETIGKSVFGACHSLKTVTLAEGVKSLGENMFYNCTGLTDISFINTLDALAESAFYGCTGLTEVVIPANIKNISPKAFSQCTNLKEVVISEGVETIEKSAFSGCTALTDIVIPDSVKSIGTYGFYECAALEEIKLPAELESIGDYQFYGCTSLKDITIPENVTSIGKYAFEKCTSLTQIVIPEKVTEIGDQAFYQCSSLKYMVFQGVPTTIGSGMYMVYDKETETWGYLDAVFYPADSGLQNKLYYANIKAGYTENADGTVTLTIDYVNSSKEDLEIVLPQDIAGKSISSIEYGEGVSEQYQTVKFICTKHSGKDLQKNTTQHWFAACSICKEENVDVENHDFADGTKACKCGYVPFTVSEEPEGKTVTYGEDIQLNTKVTTTLGTEEISYQWYENDKVLEGINSSSYTVPNGKNAGEYTYYCQITCGGYSISCKKATVVIEKKDITVQVDKKERKQGEKNPVFTWKISEGTLVEGDTTENWVVELNTTATEASAAGTYPIDGTITSANYEITVMSGVLTILEADSTGETTGGESTPTPVPGIENTPAPTPDIENTSTPKPNGGNVSTQNPENTLASDLDNKDEWIIDKDSQAVYEIMENSSAANTVVYVKSNDVNATNVVIPNQISIDGISYKVNYIAANAFRNNKKLRTITIGSNIEIIGANAFYGCTNLRKVNMGKNVTTIGKSAFQGCKKLKNIIIKTKKLTNKNVGKKVFKGVGSKYYKKVVVKVPSKKYVKKYKILFKKKGLSIKVKIKG